MAASIDVASATGDEDAVPNWLPLESNPEVLNPFVQRLGCASGWGFADVFGLDPELLMMVPQPCAALCLLFPSEKITQPRRKELRTKVAASGGAKANTPDGIFFIQQHDDIGS
jgi:ubiquitin carboxyl-terminal hydrolase L3